MWMKQYETPPKSIKVGNGNKDQWGGGCEEGKTGGKAWVVFKNKPQEKKIDLVPFSDNSSKIEIFKK